LERRLVRRNSLEFSFNWAAFNWAAFNWAAFMERQSRVLKEGSLAASDTGLQVREKMLLLSLREFCELLLDPYRPRRDSSNRSQADSSAALGVRIMAHKLSCVGLVLVSAWLAQPVFAQRGGGGGGGGGGGQCGGGSQSAASTTSASTPYALNSIASYAQSPLASQYARRQMEQQYAQQMMVMRQMYAMQMENQMLRNQLLQTQTNNSQLTQAKSRVNAHGDSNVLLPSKKNADNSTAKKKTSAKTRTVARDKQSDRLKSASKPEANKIAMNDFN
jgi:hypothetical protein